MEKPQNLPAAEVPALTTAGREKLMLNIQELIDAAQKAAPHWDEDMLDLGLVYNREISTAELRERGFRVLEFLAALQPKVVLELLNLSQEAGPKKYTCSHCWQEFTKETITAHILVCELNPVVAENQKLKARLAELEKTASADVA